MGIDLKIRVKNMMLGYVHIYIYVFYVNLSPQNVFFEFAKIRLFLAKYLQDVYIKNDIIGYTLDIP